MRLRIRRDIVRFNPRLPGGRRPLRACPYQRFNPRLPRGRRPLRSRPFPFRFNPRLPGGEGDRASASRQTAPRTRQEPARSPYRARAATGGAYGGARTDRRTSPHRRYAPEAAQNAPRASQKPVPRARRPLARIVARAPTGVHARTSVTRQKPPRTRQEPAASAYRTLLRFSTITDPVRIRLRRPGIA